MKNIKQIFLFLLIIFVGGCYEGFEQPQNLATDSDAKFVKSIYVYPNPIHFGDKLELHFELSDSCRLNMTIQNITGDIIKILENNAKYSIGKHDKEIEMFNQDNLILRSGVYILDILLDSGDERALPFEIK